MTASRVAAAMAAIITALLVQATVVGPAAYPWPVSLPAVLVAAVALAEGPGAGMSFGFAAGLVADLGSRHPAGVLALSWLVIGLVLGRIADQRSLRRDAVIIGVAGAVQSLATVLLLAVVRSSLSLDAITLALRDLLPVGLIDAALALVLVPLVRAALRTRSLGRAPDTQLTATLVSPLTGNRRE